MVQNLWWAAGHNVFAIPLAAGVLAAQGVLLAPAFAAVLMSASTVIVAINAQLLRRAELWSSEKMTRSDGPQFGRRDWLIERSIGESFLVAVLNSPPVVSERRRWAAGTSNRQLTW